MAVRKASRVLVYGVLSISVVNLVNRIVHAFTSIFLTRFLGDTGYGLWSLTMSLIGIFSLAAGLLGIGTAIIKFVSQYDGEGKPHLVKKVTILGLKIKIALGLAFGASAFVLAPVIAENLMKLPELTILIQISAIYLIATNIGVVQAVLKGLKKFHILALLSAFERILAFFLITVVLFLGFGVIGVTIANAATFLVSTTVILIVVFKKYIPRSMHSSGGDNETGLLRKMITYGAPASLGSLISSFYNDFVVIYLGIWTTAASVGLFGAARSAMNFLFITPMSIVARVLFPLASGMYSKKQIEDLRRFLSFLSKYMLFFTCYMLVFTWLFASELVVLIYSTEFEASAFYLQILMFLAIADVWTSLSGNVLLGAGYSKLTLKLSIIHVISGTALVLFVVPAFGVVGTCLLLVFLQFAIVLPLHIIYTKRIVGNFLALRAYIKSVPSILVILALMLCIKLLFAFQLSGSILSLMLLMCVFSLGFLLFSSILCLTGAVTKSEISSLNKNLSTSRMANVMKPLTFLLGLFGKLARS